MQLVRAWCVVSALVWERCKQWQCTAVQACSGIKRGIARQMEAVTQLVLSNLLIGRRENGLGAVPSGSSTWPALSLGTQRAGKTRVLLHLPAPRCS